MYKMINKELGLAKIENINEIPEELAKKMQPLDSIMIFYDPSEDIVVVNGGDTDSDLYQKLCEKYLVADIAKRIKMIQSLKSESLHICMDILDKVIEIRRQKRLYDVAKEMNRIIGQQCMGEYFKARDVLRIINSMEDSKAFEKSNIFYYGYIMGKRAERARRKNKGGQ